MHRPARPTRRARSGGGDRIERNPPICGVASNRGGAQRPRLSAMPSSMCATVSQASTDASRQSKMSFQRITTIGSMPLANSEATASRWIAVALVLEPVDLDEVAARGRRRCAAPRSASRDLLAGADEHVGHLHRPAPSAPRPRRGPASRRPARRSRRCRRARSRARARRRGSTGGRARRAAEAVDDVVGDPVALVLAEHELAREARRARGSREITSRRSRLARWTLRPASSSSSSSDRCRVARGAWPRGATVDARSHGLRPRVHDSFTRASQVGNGGSEPARESLAIDGCRT